MADEPITQPPEGSEKINTPRKALAWLWEWGKTHTIASAAILGFLAGWLLPKVAKLIWG